MMQVKETARIGFTSFLLSATMVVASGFAIGVVAQENQKSETQKTVLTKKSASGGRDPFRKYEAPAPQVKRVAGQSPIPTIQERIAQYKAQKVAAMNARMPAPKPTTALLLNEIQVIGISRSPRGYAAIIEATPIKLSYVIYPGEPFFDGQLVAIEDNRLVFRRETVFTDGHRERSVEYKPLRQPTQVNSMTVPANQSVATANP
ncbi:MAG TPA: hypothetical protein VFT48_02505 [Pyrinomonadaceae bacterium]|nr:hypothetical protein [Pyrinomonadaceae bacterium]